MRHRDGHAKEEDAQNLLLGRSHLLVEASANHKRVEAWEGTISGMKLSDHNGVLVDLEIPDA